MPLQPFVGLEIALEPYNNVVAIEKIMYCEQNKHTDVWATYSGGVHQKKLQELLNWFRSDKSWEENPT